MMPQSKDQEMEPASVHSLDRRWHCAKIRVVAFAVMEVQYASTGPEEPR